MTLNLPNEEMQVLEDFAKKWDMPKNSVVRKAIRQLQFLERLMQNHGAALDVLVGRELPPMLMPAHFDPREMKLCDVCNGWGNRASIQIQPCTHCNSTGRVYQSEEPN